MAPLGRWRPRQTAGLRAAARPGPPVPDPGVRPAGVHDGPVRSADLTPVATCRGREAREAASVRERAAGGRSSRSAAGPGRPRVERPRGTHLPRRVADGGNPVPRVRRAPGERPLAAGARTDGRERGRGRLPRSLGLQNPPARAARRPRGRHPPQGAAGQLHESPGSARQPGQARKGS